MADEPESSGKRSRRRKALSVEFTSRIWKPGESGNPGGRPRTLRDHRDEARRLVDRGGVLRMGEIAKLTDDQFNRDGTMKPLPKGVNMGDVMAAIRWLALVAYGPPQGYPPPEPENAFKGIFRPELLSPVELAQVRHSLTLIRRATILPEGVTIDQGKE